MSNFSYSSSLDEIIQQVKQEFKSFLIKRRELVLKLGNAFEKVVANPESICEEIKTVLSDEIAEHIISSRDIERYSPDKWKKKTKPQKNDNLSFLTKAEEHEKEEHRTIAIDTQSHPIYEPKSVIGNGQTNIKENTCDLQNQENSTNIENNATGMHTCPNCEQLLIENQTIQSNKDQNKTS